ncbi:biotin/lipoyl-containing protein [Leucobacter luti]|uniref:biotin/lipoyl-containing protein n=1 Tax=Leucobacter luti TaxID=340320 RepID=UPI00215DC095|nr:biotin/lipoyl-containing protein [Leucobacter luti]
MTVIVRMPEIATGSDEAAIAGWLVAVGETVAVGQALVEIETEKATVEFEAEQPGTLAGILLAAGSTAPVGAPIAVLAADGESMADALAAAGAAGAGTAPSAEAGADQAHKPVSAEAAVVPTAVPVPVPVQAAAAPEAPGARRFVSPLVRKLARERGIDLVSVRGSGPGAGLCGVILTASAGAPQPQLRSRSRLSPPCHPSQRLLLWHPRVRARQPSGSTCPTPACGAQSHDGWPRARAQSRTSTWWRTAGWTRCLSCAVRSMPSRACVSQ